MFYFQEKLGFLHRKFGIVCRKKKMNAAPSPDSAPADSDMKTRKNNSSSKSIALDLDDSDDEDIETMMRALYGDGEEFDPTLRAGSRAYAEKHQSTLLALCTGLGATTFEEGPDGTRIRSIEMGEDSQACIADIQRYLRHDDSMKSIFKLLSSWDLVQTRLLPLIYKYQDNKQLQFSATKLVVMLTMPPENGVSQTVSHQGSDEVERLRGGERERKALAFLTVPHVRYLQEMKSSFLSSHVLECFVDMLTDARARDGFDRDEHDLRVIELVLSLFRNLLSVPNGAPKNSTKDEHFSHLQEDFIVALEREHIVELVLHLIQHVNEEDTKEWNLLLLEIMYLLLRGQNPASLLASPQERQVEEEEEEEEEEKEEEESHKRAFASSSSSSSSSSSTTTITTKTIAPMTKTTTTTKDKPKKNKNRKRSQKARWTQEEDKLLRALVKENDAKNWGKICESFPERTDVQCLHRWQKVLNPNLINVRLLLFSYWW